MDHSIGTLSPAKVAFIPREKMDELMRKGDNLGRALMWSTLVDEAILREWLVNLGHRPADKRVAHLICEMMLRSNAVGLTDDDSFDLPLTQEELADTMGITPVHMNRTLQTLRGHNLITTQGKRVYINDVTRLMEFSGFNPNYLHQEGGRA
jgi:CRP-like cAMP-binding protein